MNCQEVMEYMQRQLDGDLNDRESAILAEHIEQCAECAAMYDRLKRLSSELENLPKVTPAYSLVDAILPELDRIDVEGRGPEHAAAADVAAPRSRTASRTRSRWTDRFSYRALAGAIAAGVVAGIFLITYNPQVSRQDSASTAMEAAGDAASGGSEAAKKFASPADGAESSGTSTFRAEESSSNEVQDQYGADEQAADSGETSTENTSGSDPENSVEPKNQVEPAPAEEPAAPRSTNAAEDEPVADVPAAQPDRSAGSGTKGNAGGEAESADSGEQASEAMQLPTEEADTDALKAPGGGTAGDPPTMGIAAAESKESYSPDQAYRAVIAGERITVYDSPSGAVLFEGEPKAGKLSFVAWSEDGGMLEYKLSVAGTEDRHYVIDIANNKEEQETLSEVQGQ